MAMWWDKGALQLQNEVVESEQSKLDKGINIYDEEQVNMAIVHTRQDMILICSLLGSLNAQAWAIKVLLLIIAIMLGVNLYYQ
jgi:hypothetical protein